MTSLESLRQQLSDLLILNHGDIRITEYPQVVADARELGFNTGQLSQLIQQLYSETDWRPFEVINTRLEIIFRRGIITTEQFEEMVLLAEDKINRNIVQKYVISELTKRGFKPRETNHPDPISIHNKWMTDLVWEEYKESLIEVEWLGQKANSLTKLGEISFQNKEDAKYFLRNGNYLPGLVTALSKSATKADAFARIIEDEFDSEKKYLRVLYRLNPRLPFRFQDKSYTSILELLREACSTYESYNALLESYRKGELQIWIQESDPAIASNLGTQYNLNNFLGFLYKTDSRLPFYINHNRYQTPEELTEHARKDFAIWPDIAQSIADKSLGEWFAGIGKDDWNDQIENSYSYISNAGYYFQNEINLGVVQALLHIIEPLSEKPRLHTDQQKVQLLSINGGTTLNHGIGLVLENQGYIKVKAYFKFIKGGISLDKDIFEFNSLKGKERDTINIIIDTLLLQKDQIYNLELVVSSVYQDIIIPVEIKVVFPKKAYIAKMVLYSFLTALYFGVFRFLLGIFLNDKDWILDYPHDGNPGNAIGNAPLISFFLFLFFILGGIFSFRLVKKFEKI
jgi:hypothetical protein